MIRCTAPLLALLPAMLGAAVLEDFSAQPVPSLVKAAERGVTAAIEDAAGTTDKALVLRYAEKHTGMHEAYFTKAPPLPGPGTVTLRAKRSGAIVVWGISLRVRDAKGETFQFKASGKPALLGEEWTVLSYEVAADTHAGHWGEPSTGVMEGAWAVCGIAANGDDKAATGEVWIDDLAFTPKAGK